MKIKEICDCCNLSYLRWPSERRKYCSLICSRKDAFGKTHASKNALDKSPNWKGGISKVIPMCKGCSLPTSGYRSKWHRVCWGKNRLGIKLSQEHKEKISKNSNVNKGSLSNFWRGGVSKLQRLIRYSGESAKWRRLIFERDNYICQGCFKRGGYLEANHKIPFAKIFDDFIFKYNQFSVIEDKNFLLRIALNHSEFWDVSNGETLCKECHIKTGNHGYKGRINK